MLGIILLSVILLGVVMLSVPYSWLCSAESQSVMWHYHECPYAECCYAESPSVLMLSTPILSVITSSFTLLSVIPAYLFKYYSLFEEELLQMTHSLGQLVLLNSNKFKFT
jgi:hypothetical protein